MGLSSKQVSSDRHGWNQALLQASTLELTKPPPIIKRQAPQLQQQQQHEALKCPRCDSSNTKFCYYNNYNKSQPRHFCKACKRHWTKGGTLRNVPVGGGRKNKRLKTSNGGANKTGASKVNTTISTTSNTISSSTTNDNIKALLQTQQQPSSRFSLPLGEASSLLTTRTSSTFDEKNSFSEAFYQTLVRQPPSSLPETSIAFNNKSLTDGIFLGISQNNNDQDNLQFPYSNLGNFESNPCSISSSNFYNYTEDHHHHQHQHQHQQEHQDAANGLEETVMNTSNSSSMSVIDMSNNWGWDDFDKFVSVEADLTMPWDETEINPPAT